MQPKPNENAVANARLEDEQRGYERAKKGALPRSFEWGDGHDGQADMSFKMIQIVRLMRDVSILCLQETHLDVERAKVVLALTTRPGPVHAAETKSVPGSAAERTGATGAPTPVQSSDCAVPRHRGRTARSSIYMSLFGISALRWRRGLDARVR